MEEETVEESPINGFSRLFVLESPLYWVFSWIYVSYFHPVRMRMDMGYRFVPFFFRYLRHLLLLSYIL